MKTLTRIALLCAVLTAFLCATAYAGSDGASVQVIGKPTVSGHGIGVNDLDGLEEIAVPVQVSSDAPTNITLFASFYDGNGKYVGMGATSASVDSETSFVIMPVEDVVTGAETLKMTVTDAGFRPLSVSNYSLKGGGGGGSSSGTTTKTYYLNAAASFVSENGGSGSAYLMKTEPTEDTDLSEAYPFSTTFQYQSASGSFVYYVIFTPGQGSELAYPRIVQGSASGVARVPVTLKAAPDAVVYRIWTYGSSSESNAPTVTMKSAVRGSGSSGGGGGSSGGMVTTYYYYAQTNASVTPTDAPHGKVFLTTTAPTNTTAVQETVSLSFGPAVAPAFAAYAVFVPDDGYEIKADGIERTGNVTIGALTDVTLAGDVAAKYCSFSVTGQTVRPTDATATITATFTAVVNQDYTVTVLEPKYEGAKTDVSLLNPYVKSATAQADTSVTVYVPAVNGCQVKEVAVTGKASGKTVSAKLTSAEDANPLEYAFTMPDEDVEAQVTFTDVPEETLTYKVNVNFIGNGSVTLNIGGTEEKFTSAKAVTISMRKSEYLAQYGESDFADSLALPVYLTAEPIPADGYRYDKDYSRLTDGTKDDPDVTLTPGMTMELEVVFVKVGSFGYNLTIIGNGKVEVTLDDEAQTFTNDTGKPKTESFSELFEGVDKVKIAVTKANAADGYVFDENSDNVMISGGSLTQEKSVKVSDKVSIGEGIVDIVVGFRNEDAAPVLFTVTLGDGNGAVTVKSENGKFVKSATVVDEATLTGKNAKTSFSLTKAGTQTYCAWSGTVITLIPEPANGYEVDAITVNGANAPDEIPANGFSYTLPKSAGDDVTVMEVTFKQSGGGSSGGLDHENETPMLSGVFG